MKKNNSGKGLKIIILICIILILGILLLFYVAHSQPKKECTGNIPFGCMTNLEFLALLGLLFLPAVFFPLIATIILFVDSRKKKIIMNR